MKKAFGLAFLLTISTSVLAYAVTEDSISVSNSSPSAVAENIENQANMPKVITEEIPNGRIEKLLDENNRVIAEKKNRRR